MDKYLIPPNSTISRRNSTYPAISPNLRHSALINHVVLVTGAGRGIGRATALAFAAAGAHVVCLSRTLLDLQSLVQEIQCQDEQLNGSVRNTPSSSRPMYVVGDVTDPSCPKRVVSEVEDKLGSIDILINNAGTSRISTMEHESNFEIPWKVIETNLRGSLAFAHAVVPSMVAAGRGTIINVVSALGVTSPPYFWAYSSAKAGMIRATHIIDQELRTKGVSIFAVHPGMVADTTLGVGALNEAAKNNDQELPAFMDHFIPSMGDSLTLPAHTFVALCTNQTARLLSGRYIDSCQDLGEVLEAASRGKLGDEEAGLYQLKIDSL
ncbi:MAG: hypothetical protein Q9191_002684 [Dirinaria sp. TL-2023a]